MTAVQLQKIEHAFGSRPLLRGLDLEVASGEYLVLLGRSGCGKTTLLRAIAGLLRPNGGKIRFDGQSVTNLPPRRRKVAFVFQHDALYPHLTVRDSIQFSLRNQDGLGAIDPRIDRAAELTGIANLLDRFPDQLSGGERRRCALAKAVASGNRLRLLDEPLSALDAPLRFSLQEDILRWHQSDGGTTIHVTHDGYEAMRMADRIAVLDDGQIVQCDRPESLLAKPCTVGVAKAIGVWPMQWLRASVREKKLQFESSSVRCLMDIDLPDGDFELGFRPEDVHLQPIAFASNGGVRRQDAKSTSGAAIQQDGTITDCRQLESNLHLRIKSGETTFLAVVNASSSGRQWSAGQPIGIGQPIGVQIPLATLHCFDHGSGRRIDFGQTP